MSAIGDYIHYSARGYNKHGITKDGEKTDFSFDHYRNNVLKRRIYANFPTITKREKENIRENLGYILSNNNEKRENVKEIQSYIEKVLTDRWKDSMGKVNWETGNISQESVLEKLNVSINQIKIKKGQKRIYLSTVYSRVQELMAIRDQIKDRTTLERVNNIIAETKRKLSIIFKAEKDSIESLLGENPFISLQTQRGSDRLYTNSMIEELNKVIKEITYTPPINLQKGDLFEYVISLSGLMGQTMAEESLQNTIDELVNQKVGDQSEAINFNGESFSKDINFSALKLHEALDENGNSISITPIYTAGKTSQGKIDVNFKLDSGKNIGISAKNVNLNSGRAVHVVSGSDMLFMIQDLDSNFVNHFLNLTTYHNDSYLLDNSKILEARNTMKMVLLYKALSGDNFQRTPADVFILNDNSKKGKDSIYIYSIAELIEKAYNNIDKYASVTSNDQDLSSIVFQNRWANSYGERITNIVQNIRVQKISAALQPEIFKS